MINHRFPVFILFIFLVTFIGCGKEKDVFDFSSSWRVKPGFDAAWLDGNDPNDWIIVDLPANLSQLYMNGVSDGFITLQKELPAWYFNINNPGIDTGRMLDASIVYINQHKLEQRGNFNPYQSGALLAVRAFLPPQYIKKSGNFITIVLKSNGDYPLQILEKPRLGNFEDLIEKHYYSLIITYIILSIYLFVGVYHIILGIKRPQDKYNLYFGCFAFLVSIYWFVSNTPSREIIFINDILNHRRFEFISLFLIIPFFLFYISEYFYQKISKPVFYLSILYVLLVVGAFFSDIHLLRKLILVWDIVFVIQLPYIFYLSLVPAFRQYNRNYVLILGIVLLSVAVVNDIASSRDLIHTPKMAQYALFIFIMGIGVSMMNRFIILNGLLEMNNISLNKKMDLQHQEIVATNRLFREIFEHSTDALFILDEKSSLIEDCNSTAVRMLYKKNKSDLIGVDLRQFLDAREKNILIENNWSYGEIELKILTGSDVEKWGNLAVESIHLHHKTILLVRIADISLHKLREKELILAKEKALEVSALKTDFLSNISHEFRTPMNGIIGMSQLLRDSELDESQKELLNHIQVSSDILMELIENLLIVAEMDSGEHQVVKQPFVLREILGILETEFRPRMNQKKLEFHWDIADNLPEILIGDEYSLRKIIKLLLNNAMKFTEKGFVSVSLVKEEAITEKSSDKTTITFSIADSGIGIPIEKQNDIFNLFVQLDMGINKKYDGVGLGLGIIKRLVAMLEGDIHLESSPGNGSIFSISIPFSTMSNTEE